MLAAAAPESSPYWAWLGAGFVFLILETFAPGAVFLWMGVAAFVVGIATLAWPAPWTLQAVAFGVLALAALFAYRRWQRAHPVSAAPKLNRRGEAYVGRRFTLVEPIVDGIGRLRVDDTQWRISGPDLPAGTAVRVIRADGATLRVVATSGEEQPL